MEKQGLKATIVFLVIMIQLLPIMSQTATKLSVLDTRNVNTGPNGFDYETKIEFKNRMIIGVPGTGTYSGLLTIAPWSDNSGNKHHQLNFNDGGIFYRTGWPQDSTWGTWAKLILGDANGNIGLGTATPETKLHIKGDPGSLAYITTNNATANESASILFQGARGIVGYDGVSQGMKISTSDNSKPIIFTNSLTNGQGELMRINGNGNVGIGTTAPAYKLEVTGSAKINNSLIVAGTGPDIGGAVSICNTSKNQAGQAYTWTIYNMSGTYGNSLQFWAYDNVGCASGGLCGNRFTITDDGKVGIGTSVIPSDYKLAVTGKIIAEEVVVKLQSNWPDYVFKPNYNLMPLHQVEQFVTTNNHLPGIPSATEVQNGGISMGDMQNKLLQKIEELTLYIIEQDKKITNLEEKLK